MPDLPGMGAVSDLIGRIYDTCLDERQWDPFLRELTKAFGSDQALRVSIDSNPIEPGSITYVGMDMGVVSQWAESKDHVDVWYRGLMSSRSDTTYRGQDLCSNRVLRESAFYADSLRHLDINHTLGILCRENTDRSWALAIYHSKRAGRFSKNQAKVYGLLLPHFSRAANLRRLMARRESQELALKAALEGSPFGVAILDSCGSLAWANGKADRMFRETDGITVSYGRIRLWAYESQKKFDKAIRHAILTANHSGMDVDGAIAIPRPSGETPYHALVSPVNRASELIGELDRAACIVMLHDTSRIPPLSAELIAEHHGLSKAEAQLCVALYRQGSLPNVLHELDITRNTAKTHLSRIFSKLGVSNQAQLLQRLAGGLNLPAD